MTKKIIIIFTAVLFICGVWQREMLVYGFRQAKGQFKIIANTRPIEQVLADVSFPDSLKNQIKLIQEIKQFAVDSLGLKPSENYTTFYDQHNKPLMWVITAAEPFALKPKVFHFPILGEFTYKGHFEEAIAQKEEQELKKLGFDTQINNASAWSTLGYLKDPILSSMLKKSEGRLAALIIHELTHGTVFIKNNLTFNENLADFVGDYGALYFLKAKYGKKSSQLKKYEFSKKYADAYSQHIMLGAKKLDSLYHHFSTHLSSTQKKNLKDSLILQIMTKTDTILSVKSNPKKTLRFDKNNLPNNAFFVAYATYQSKQNEFEEEFKKDFNSDFRAYLAYLKTKY